MTRLALLLVACTLAGCPATTTGTVTTGPGPGHPMPHDPPPAVHWDSTGWVLLGEQTVNGRTDRDTILVNKRARYDKLTVVVENSDLDMLDFDVEFANGERWSPKLKHHFQEGQRTRAIDLPGDDRHIAKIVMLYKNTPGGGNAHVAVYGKDIKGGGAPPVRPSEPMPPPPPPPAAPAWDATGWTLLGSQWVDGKKDRDIYQVGKKAGRFDVITIVVKDSDLEMDDFVITFENGQKWEPKLKHTFKEGARSRQIDLPKSDRYIKHIEVLYKNLPGGGKARVEIYGKDTNQGKDPKKPR